MKARLKQAARFLFRRLLAARRVGARSLLEQLKDSAIRQRGFSAMFRLCLTLYYVKRTAQECRDGRWQLRWGQAVWWRREVQAAFVMKLAQWADAQNSAAPDPYHFQRSNNRMTEADAIVLRERAADFAYRPLISILVPVYNAAAEWLERLVDSIRAQVYDRWELVLVDDASPDLQTWATLQKLAEHDSRLVIDRLSDNRGVSRATNRAAELASGEFLGFADHVPERVADCDLIYTDEEMVPETTPPFPVFKPAFSPELLTAYNYICHFLVLRRTVFDAAGGLRPGTDGAQDYDLILRSLPLVRRVEHVPRILYRWRIVPRSLSRRVDRRTGRTLADERIDPITRRVLDDHFIRAGIPARCRLVGRWSLPVYYPLDQGKVTIVICTRDHPAELARAIRSIEERTDYPNYEILIVDNGSQTRRTRRLLAKLRRRHKIVRIESGAEGFNWSSLNNQAARIADGRFLLFLNDDVKVLERNWLSALVGTTNQPGVGAAGALLEYPDGRLQHAGVILGAMGWGPWHVLMGASLRTPTAYQGLASFPRNCIAVTGACLLTPRDTFLHLGGFDETELRVAFSDVDYCLRLKDAGLRCAYVPQARLIHYEGRSRGCHLNPAEATALARRTRGIEDPYWNPGFTRESHAQAVSSRRRATGMHFSKPPRVLILAERGRAELALPQWPEIFSSLEAAGRCRPIVAAADGVADLYSFAKERFERESPDVLFVEGAATARAVEAAAERGVPCVWRLPQRLFPMPAGAWSPGAAVELARLFSALALPYQVVYSDLHSRSWAQAGWLRENARVVESVCPAADALQIELDRANWRREWNVGPDGFVIASAAVEGEGLAHENVFAALRRLSAARRRRVFLLLIGPPGSAVALPPDVRGIVAPRSDGVRSILAAADVVVCQPFHDVRSPATLQAMAAAAPLMATSLVRHADLLQSGSTGFQIPSFRPVALTRRLAWFMDHPTERRNMGARGLDWLASRAHPQTVVSEWGDLLLEAAELGVRPAKPDGRRNFERSAAARIS